MRKVLKNDEITIVINEKEYSIAKSDFNLEPLSRVVSFENFMNLINTVTVNSKLNTHLIIGDQRVTLKFPLTKPPTSNIIQTLYTDNLIAAESTACSNTYYFKRKVVTQVNLNECEYVKMRIILPDNFKENCVNSMGVPIQDLPRFAITMGNATEYIFSKYENCITVTMPYSDTITTEISTESLYYYKNSECSIKFIITHFYK